jgi:tetratricopeptide (TPR) repeat protein
VTLGPAPTFLDDSPYGAGEGTGDGEGGAGGSGGGGSTPPGSRPPRRADQTLQHGAMVGRYMVLRMLGRGGVGTVYAAHDPKLDRQVALKLLHSARGDAPERLVREAQALARLSDPHVVSVYDAGELDGRVFIAMQLVDGTDLATALIRRKPAAPQVLAWFVAAGRGLAAAHAAGLVHRDFKPSNVLIDRHGHIAVTDFGLVRSVAPDTTTDLTGMGDILGTPAFMSPEQHDLQPATPASDQFSFCVSLWDALFGQHPFVEGDRGAMSPYEIGYRIFDGALIPPPRGTRVPRRVIDALTRGLSRDPAGRWPTMDVLLAELAPDRRRRIAPAAVAGLAAAAIGGGAMWVALGGGGDDDDAAACRAAADRRIGATWSTASGTAVRDRFAQTQRSYADHAATAASTGLDRYASRWRSLAGDVCVAERAARGPSELVARRRSCLDGRLDALRGVVNLLATESRPEFVDHAQAIVDGLPELGDCTDPGVSPGAPPADRAAEIGAIDVELALVAARGHGGDPRAIADLTALAARADATGWGPLRVRAYLALGQRKTAEFDVTYEELKAAGTLATSLGLDRDAARAWSSAVIAAGLARQPDVVATLAPLASAVATRTGERYLEVEADVARGRAYNRLGKYQDAADACKPAYAAAQSLTRATTLDDARDCMLESLVPLGAFTEAAPLLDTRITEATATLGADHPKIADYLSLRASILLRTGKIAEARADAERLLAIRLRVFEPRHFKIAEAKNNIAQVALAEGKVAEAKQLYAEVIALAEAAKPQPLLLLGNAHMMLGYIAQQAENDLPRALAHFEQAIALTRKRAGDGSLEVAVLQSNYGQIQAIGDYAQGLATLAEARAVLDKLGDKRAILVTTAMAEIEADHGRWPAARDHAEDMLAKADADADPVNVALAKWVLARALVATGGDRARARLLASEARDVFAQLGAAQAKYLAAATAWLKKN